MADCHNELRVLLQGRGEFELAEEEARRALHVYKQLFGDLPYDDPVFEKIKRGVRKMRREG